ncbi:MAG: hypothetical protein K0B37_08660, partial [Bacteroidales bacterium]|nr:hypothetical protein [Bacteroidales bacterium]
SKVFLEAIDNKAYVRFKYLSKTHLVKPLFLFPRRSKLLLYGYDLVLNEEVEFEVRYIEDLEIETTPFIKNLHPKMLLSMRNDVEFALDNMLYVRFDYTNLKGEQSLRTIGHFNYTEDYKNYGYDREHIRGHCFLRGEERTFKLLRFDNGTVLNLSYNE